MKIFTCSKKIFLSAFLLFCLGFTGSDELRFHIVNDNGYNTLFTRNKGWTGGDIAHTVPLTDSLILWLFGDSWIGHLENNTHSGSKMICNSLAIQYGKAANEKNLKFYYLTKDKKPAPLFSPTEGKGQYWLTGGGIKTKNGLYLIASQIVKTDDKSVFGFKSIGNTILAINNPFDEPYSWRVEEVKIPFFLNTEDTEIDFGIPQFIKDGNIYIYGVELSRKENDRYMLLARVTEGQILNFDKWEFYSNGQWGKDFTKADRLCNHYGAEYSVSFHPFLNKFITVYTELGMSDKIMLRTAANPEGPWSEQIEIYKAPETGWSKNYFCYAGRAHIELSGLNDLLVSYVCNSFDFAEMVSDTRIYRPKFIRIKFEK
jgi:hypothetical protein